MPTPARPGPDSPGTPPQLLLTAVSSVIRWQILAEMAQGKPIMVSHIAPRLGQSVTTISKHMGMLLRAGVVRRGIGRLYYLADAYQPGPDATEIDFGWFVMRFTPRK